MRCSRRRLRLVLPLAAAAVLGGTWAPDDGGAVDAKKRKPIGHLTRIVTDTVSLQGSPLLDEADLFAGNLITTRQGGGAWFNLQLKKTNCFIHDRTRANILPAPRVAVRVRVGEISCGTHVAKGVAMYEDARRTRISMKDPVFSLYVTKRRTVVKVHRGVVVVTGPGGAAHAVAVGRNQQTSVAVGADPRPTQRARFTVGERNANASIEAKLPKARDIRPPRVELEPPRNRGTTVVVAFTADEANVTFVCQFDGSGFHPCTSPLARKLSEGSHTVSVRAFDAAGNSADAVSIRLDVVNTCLGRTATIFGTSGDDVIEGTAGDDVILGLGGKDEIRGLDGNDLICGGDGNDSLDGGNGNDRIDGGADDDGVQGSGGGDVLDGGAGNDYLDGGAGGCCDQATNGGNDTLRGGDGADDMWSSDFGRATMDGGVGNDYLHGLNGDDSLDGGDGDDIIDGGAGNDSIVGGLGADKLNGFEGNDKLNSIDTVAGNDHGSGGSGFDDCIGDPQDSFVECEPRSPGFLH